MIYLSSNTTSEYSFSPRSSRAPSQVPAGFEASQQAVASPPAASSLSLPQLGHLSSAPMSLETVSEASDPPTPPAAETSVQAGGNDANLNPIAPTDTDIATVTDTATGLDAALEPPTSTPQNSNALNESLRQTQTENQALVREFQMMEQEKNAEIGRLNDRLAKRDAMNDRLWRMGQRKNRQLATQDDYIRQMEGFIHQVYAREHAQWVKTMTLGNQLLELRQQSMRSADAYSRPSICPESELYHGDDVPRQAAPQPTPPAVQDYYTPSVPRGSQGPPLPHPASFFYQSPYARPPPSS